MVGKRVTTGSAQWILRAMVGSRARFAALLLALFLGAACDGSGLLLLVELRTDLRPGYDFVTARTTIVEAPAGGGRGDRVTLAVATSDDFTTGQRIAELGDLPAGTYSLVIELMDTTSVVIALRRLRVELAADHAATVVITSDCFGVSCPAPMDAPEATECLSGRCVTPDCSVEHPDGCGTGCASAADCTDGAACAERSCLDGECFRHANDAACGAGEYCDVHAGCVPLPIVRDGGAPPPDGGSPETDAGPPTCATGCNDGDACTTDACVDGACVFTGGCGAGQYCASGSCQPLPVLQVETSDGVGCANLGRDHTTAFEWRRTVTGRPNADVTQYNGHLSCGEPGTAAETFRLDASGRNVRTSYTGAQTNCWLSFYGAYEAWVVVDGQMSNTVVIDYYNDRCANVSSCAAAAGFCSPCRGCDFDGGTEYCYAGTSCAPVPTFDIETSDGPGCADLGANHLAPSFLWRRTMTGRASASATQYNSHVSCGGSFMAAPSVSLDASGTFTETASTGPSANCTDTTLGRWQAYAEVDGERSSTREITYYNSSCPGLTTCAAARTFCP